MAGEDETREEHGARRTKRGEGKKEEKEIRKPTREESSIGGNEVQPEF